MFDGSLFDINQYGPAKPDPDKDAHPEPAAEPETTDVASEQEPLGESAPAAETPIPEAPAPVEKAHSSAIEESADQADVETLALEDIAPADEPIESLATNEPVVPEAAPAPAQRRPAAAPTALYRKYRPQSFDSDDLFGQDHVVNTLRNAIALDRIAHAYLFCGPRGTGKTTTARILAKAVNCEDPDPHKRPCNHCASCIAINTGATTDVIEIDAASNRGIDDIRDLRERVKYAPTQLRTKFYIIDEAHQITGAAANAFLKTLEEPPAHTKFVLATTDPEDLLQTIVSRCQRFDFRRINMDAMIANLTKIAAAEHIEIDDDAKVMIARHATGSLRDAQGLLDQVAVYRENVDDATTHVSADLVRKVLGVSRNDRVETIATALADRDPGAGMRAIGDAVADGEDVRQLARQLLTYVRELLLARSGAPSDLDGAGKDLAQRFDLNDLAELARLLGDIDFKVKHATIPQLPLEIAVVEGALRGARPAAQPSREASHTPPPPTPGPAPASGSLINRVQGGGRRTQPEQPIRPTPGTNPTAETPKPAARQAESASHASPPRQDPAQRSRPESAGPAGTLSLETVRDRWSRVKADVSALNVRTGALLSEMDPVALEGTTVILTVPYPFHAAKMNSEETRVEVEKILSRVMNAALTLQCFTTEEFRARPVRTSSSSVPEPSSSKPEPEQTPKAPDIDTSETLKALRNLFDAEEIDPEES